MSVEETLKMHWESSLKASTETHNIIQKNKLQPNSILIDLSKQFHRNKWMNHFDNARIELLTICQEYVPFCYVNLIEELSTKRLQRNWCEEKGTLCGLIILFNIGGPPANVLFPHSL